LEKGVGLRAEAAEVGSRNAAFDELRRDKVGKKLKKVHKARCMA